MANAVEHEVVGEQSSDAARMEDGLWRQKASMSTMSRPSMKDGLGQQNGSTSTIFSTSNFLVPGNTDTLPSQGRSRREQIKETMSRTPYLSTLVAKVEDVMVRISEFSKQSLSADDWMQQHVQATHPNDWRLRYFKHFSIPFDALCMVVIVMNIFFLVLSINAEMDDSSPLGDSGFDTIDWLFTAFYIVEIGVRMITQRGMYFLGPHRGWHAFDCLLVLLSFFARTHISWLRALRALRGIRILRAAKFFRFYKLVRSGALEVMMNCLIGSVNMLFWCMVMVLFFTFLFSVLFVNAAADYINTKELSKEAIIAEEPELFQWFGSVQQGMFTLLMVTTGGADWRDAFDALKPVGWLVSTIFVFYIMLFTIAVWNIVTSTFVDRALKLAKASDVTIIMEARLQDKHDKRELWEKLTRMDLDKNGRLDLHEFEQCMRMPEFKRWLDTRGIDIKETKTFFHMISRNQPTVDIDHVVEACMRMRGQATSVDLNTMRYELRRVSRAILCRARQGESSMSTRSTAGP
jgi:uncharacterized membrane protein